MVSSQRSIFLISAYFIFATLFFSCSGNHKKTTHNLIQLYKNGEFKQAEQTLAKSDLAKDKDSTLLKYLNQGSIFFAQEKYSEAIISFEKAIKFYDDLYTKKISKALKSFAVNDTFKDFKGNVHEISSAYFLKSLSHYLLFLHGKDLNRNERLRELRSARAQLLAWDSFWKTYRADVKNGSVFRFDMLAKIYGAFIHQAMNLRSDDQIALQLFKDANQILDENYLAYKSYNNKFKEFKQRKKEKFLAEENYKATQKYLHEKILSLTRALRPKSYQATAKKIKADKSLVLKYSKKFKRDNLALIVQDQLIPEKKANRYNISLEGLATHSNDPKTRSLIRNVGKPILGAFISHTLGLQPKAHEWSPPRAVFGVYNSEFAAGEVGFAFELPKVTSSYRLYKVRFKIHDENNLLIKEGFIPLISPLGDIAEEVVAEEGSDLFFKIGSRVGSKHLLAIGTAYATYKAIKKKSESEFLGKNAALLSYLAAAKGIDASEKADVRYWSLLPKNVFMTQLYLKPGKYKIKYDFIENNGDVSSSRGPFTLEINRGNAKVIHNLLSPNT